MEPIQSTLQRWVNDRRVQERLNTTRKELLADPFIQTAFSSMEEVTDEMIEQGMVKLYEYKKRAAALRRMSRLAACPNMLQAISQSYSQQESILICTISLPVKSRGRQ